MYEIKRTLTGSEPVTLAEMKTYLMDRSDADADNDVLITGLISSARAMAEQYCDRSFVAQTIEYQDEVPLSNLGTEIVLPYPNHIAITQVKVEGTVTTAYTSAGLNRLKVTLTTTSAITDTGFYTVYIKYTAGDFTEAIKTAIKTIVKDMYENRGKDALTENGINLLSPFRIYS